MSFKAEQEEANVLVVGGGPVGLTMAAEMSYRGLSTILLEKRPTTSDSPKAFALTSRSLEHFRRLGLQEKIQTAAYPSDQPVSVILAAGLVKGRKAFHFNASPWGHLNKSEEAIFLFFSHKTSLGLPMMIPQFTSEAVIRKHVEETAKCVKMFWGWSVKSLEQDESGVTVKAENEAGEKRVFRAKYLVGCDGGSSFVRKSLGLHMYGRFVVSRAVTIWFKSPMLTEHLKENRKAGFAFIMNKKISCLLVMLNQNGDFAVHVYLPTSTSDERVQWHVQNATWCVEAVLGSSDFPIEIKSASGYNMHGLLTTKFRVGRCLLAGDSAHQWLPAGGLGLNTGISDVADLAWKLEAAVKGYGGDALLDSYQIERRPLADLTRRYALDIGVALIFNTPWQIWLRSTMVSNPLTSYILGKLAPRGVEAMSRGGIDLVIGFQYSNSNVIAHEFEEDGKVRVKEMMSAKFMPSSLPGCRAPHVEIPPDCPSVVDLFGKGFVLLVVGKKGEELGKKEEESSSGADSCLKELKEGLKERGVAFSTHTLPPLPEVTALYDRRYFLVRPDGVVAWRSDYQPNKTESAKILDTVLGHMTTSSSRLPLPTFSPSPLSSSEERGHAVGFLRDLSVRFSITTLVRYAAGISWPTAGAIGLGAFLLLRTLSVREPAQKTFSISRHRAAAITEVRAEGNKEEESKFEVLPRHVGEFGMHDVLIRVHATTFSQSDLSTAKGCLGVGKKGHGTPLILGRECCGEVVAVGDHVSNFLPGDMVYAATPHLQGCHAQLVAIDERHVAFKPKNVSENEAATLPWAAVTAWSAVVTNAGLTRANTRGKRVLVVQNDQKREVAIFALQLLKAWGAHVTLCPTSDVINTSPARHSEADRIVSEEEMTKMSELPSLLRGGYDVVFDTVGGKSGQASISSLKLYRGAVYVSCVSPHDTFVNSLGGFFGELAFSTLYRWKIFANRLLGGRSFYYSSPEVKGAILEEVRTLVEQGAIRSSQIGAVYTLDEITDAYKQVESGQTPGQVVITVP